MKHRNVLWIITLALGCCFDFLFWRHAPGVNFAVYVVLCLAGGFLALHLLGARPSWKSLLLLLPILFFAVMTFIRQEPLGMLLSYGFTLFFMAVLAITYMGGRWQGYGLIDYLVSFFKLAGSMLARPLTTALEDKKQSLAESSPSSSATRKASAGWKIFWAVLRGLLIAIPILVVFAALLASADLVFAQRLQKFIELFNLERLPEYIFRCVYIFIGAYLLAGVLLHALHKSRAEKLIGEEKPLVPPFLGFTESAVVLGGVALLFAVFVTLQFQYFFGGQVNIHIDGYTYAEYARRGFAELVAVAFFSLLLFLGLSAVVKRENKSQRWSFSALGILLVLLVGVLLSSAFQRLTLYEAAYGFSRLRAYTHVFMFWLGVLLAVTVLLDILRKERLFALSALIVSLGFAATLTIMNVDGFIVRQNVQRAVHGEELDVAYLASLSSDARPALAATYQSASLPKQIRDASGAVLACLQAARSSEPDASWQAFHFSLWRGEQAMQTVDLANYQVFDSNAWPIYVVSPTGIKYDCWGNSD